MKNRKCRTPLEQPRGLLTWAISAGLAGILTLAVPITSQAQETSAARQQDTTRATAAADSSSDSTKWGYTAERNPSDQNPPGYRGMERPAGLSDSGRTDTTARADATSRVNQMQRQDSMAAPDQNPPGYRGMERPVGQDSATAQQQDTSAAKQAVKKSGAKKKHAVTKKKTAQQASRDTTGQDSTKWGYKVNREPEVQNPQGYRGMERPVNVFPADSAKRDSGAAADATSRVNQMERQDSMAGGEHQNPPGYRGMERPAGLDSAQSQGSSRDTSARARQDTSPVNRERSAGQSADTTSTVRVGQDTTADSARYGANAEEGSSSSGENPRDSVDVVHRQRQVPPGVGNQPPPYPADSERAWVRQGNDSVSVDLQESADSSGQNQKK